MRRPATAAVLALLTLAACATGPTETPVERQARLNADCVAAGFQKDTESYRLCLLLKEQNERLGAVERRLARIDQDVSFPRFGGFYGYSPYYFGYGPFFP